MSRLPRKSAAALIPVALFAGAIALRVGHDEPRLVRTAGVSAPLEESSTTSTSTAKVAELDATVENHEARISVLESSMTTAPAVQAPVASSPVAPAVEAGPTTTTTTSVVTTTTAQPAPTTTSTFYGEPWWCTVPGAGRSYKMPCDSTTTTAPIG